MYWPLQQLRILPHIVLSLVAYMSENLSSPWNHTSTHPNGNGNSDTLLLVRQLDHDLQDNRHRQQHEIARWPLPSPAFHRIQLPLIELETCVHHAEDLHALVTQELPAVIQARDCSGIYEKAVFVYDQSSTLVHCLGLAEQETSSSGFPSLKRGRLAHVVGSLQEQSKKAVSIWNLSSLRDLFAYRFPSEHEREHLEHVIATRKRVGLWEQGYAPLDTRHLKIEEGVLQAGTQVRRAVSQTRKFLESSKEYTFGQDCDLIAASNFCQDLHFNLGFNSSSTLDTCASPLSSPHHVS